MTVVRARRVRVPLLALFAALTSASTAAPGTAAPTATELVQRLQAAWDNRDLAAYLGLWRFAGEDAHRTEREWAEPRLVGEEAQLILDPAPREAAARLEVTGAAVSVTEPRGRVDQVRWVLERGADGWAITRRDGLSQIDGLVHLSLDPTGYRAAGMTLKLPDFELKMTRGTLFTSPRSVGPTVLVFVGEGTVRVTPAPETEQQQLRQFAGRPHLDEKVRVALARIHPAELHRVLSPVRFEPGPEAERHRPAAQRFFREHVDDAFVLDAALPRSPWWLLPSLGDALVVFDSRKGTLSFAVSRSEREAISLFDRERQRQINLYALPGDDRPWDEDADRSLDVLHQDLTVRFDPDRLGLAGEVRLRLRILQPSSTIRLRLADPLKVVSLRSEEGGNHLFFRVRHQDTLMVSLGALAGTTGDVTFVVTFSGSLTPLRVEREVVQLTTPDVGEMESDSIPVEQALVYGNQTPWYPQGPPDDYATAVVRTDTPEGYLGVTGGRQVSVRTVDGRTRAEYRLEQPGKYVTVAVGRLAGAGAQETSGVRVEAYAVPRLRRMAPERISDTMAILRFYTEEFGPAPYPVLNLVLTESRVPGGHSPPGMVVVALRPMLLKGSLRDDPASFPDIPDYFLAHELAHQWWGHGVSGQNYRERWISEGFAQYASALWVRHRRGETVFRSMLSRFARWGLRYADEGPIHLGHRLGHIKNDPQIFRAVVYDKAAYVLHMLRQIVGDETFRRALVQLQKEARFTKIGTEDIRMSMEAASGRDLREYFAAWIYGTRLPRLEMTHKSERAEGGWRTEVRVRGEDLPGPLPLELAIAHAGGTELRKVELGIDGGSWTVETPGPPRKVEVNRDRGLLATIRSGRS